MKPGKLRLVFDAAARSHGVSLNDALLTGPDLLCPLPSVLYSFRGKRIAFGADIREMFHQVRVRQEDLPAQLFLWRGTTATKEPDTLQMQVMTFGATSSPTTAQYVKNLNAEDLNADPETRRAIQDRHYVDDYLDSCDRVEEAVERIDSVIETHRRGGFQIRHWISNNKRVLASIPEELRSSNVVALGPQSSPMPQQRTLGLIWDPNDDSFQFTNRLDQGVRPTKRNILRQVMSMFDPLGFLTSFLVRAKILLQEVWRAGTSWDEVLPSSLLPQWEQLCLEIREVEAVRVPRWYSFSPAVVDLQLHVFCDASEKAFAAAAYFRVETEAGVNVAFITAKTRVSPLKPMSIPRLELQAAVMASRLASSLCKEHMGVNQVILWSDSKTVLQWIHSDSRRYKPFVAHRLSEIADLTSSSSWRWVPSRENVADDASRGVSIRQLLGETRWFQGPPFLSQPECEWPEKVDLTTRAEAEEAELRKQFVGVTTDGRPSRAPTADLRQALPSVARFSSWLKLIRCTAWVLRFVQQTRRCSRQSPIPVELLPAELKRAETLWVRQVQEESFPEDFDNVRRGKPLPSGSRLITLGATLDADGVMRLDSRLPSPGGYLLDPKHPYTRLLVMQHHVWQRHHGQERIVNALRQQYHILKLRSAVRSAWSACQQCRNTRAKPLEPRMAPLPSCRLAAHHRPFTETGLDYFGPLGVTIGRSHNKRYGALFTCLTTRAVHLELAANLTADSTISAIRRMVCRRGRPRNLYSDNGTNLRGADKELRRALTELNQAKVISELATDGITWHFNPPAAPHMGGAWERLVRSVKVSLRAILKERSPREETLLTALVEAEYLVNSSPLTHVSLSAVDEEPLTPNHFLVGSSGFAPPPGTFTDTDLKLRKQWRISQWLADQFWKRWVNEYLPTLARRTAWQKHEQRSLRVGDLVVIADPDMPRGLWPRGIVQVVYPGKDGVVRMADVKTASGVFRRPARKLCPLDVSSS